MGRDYRQRTVGPGSRRGLCLTDCTRCEPGASCHAVFKPAGGLNELYRSLSFISCGQEELLRRRFRERAQWFHSVSSATPITFLFVLNPITEEHLLALQDLADCASAISHNGFTSVHKICPARPPQRPSETWALGGPALHPVSCPNGLAVYLRPGARHSCTWYRIWSSGSNVRAGSGSPKPKPTCHTQTTPTGVLLALAYDPRILRAKPT
jgi:hypothetical protein